jgi:hypothetical protein
MEEEKSPMRAIDRRTTFVGIFHASNGVTSGEAGFSAAFNAVVGSAANGGCPYT